MEPKYQIESPLVIYLSNVHTLDVWTQQKRHFFQQQQEHGPITCSQGNRDEDFAVHLLDIHARFCFMPTCRITADHVDVDIASTSTWTEIPISKALKSSKKSRNQTSMGTSGSLSLKSDHSSSTEASHSGSLSKSDHSSCTTSSEFVVKDSQAADDVGLQASSSTTVMTALNLESSVDEMACPSTSAMRTPSGRHGVNVQMSTSEGGEDDSDGWVSEEEPLDMSPDTSPDHATDRIILEIKTECDDDEAGKEDTSDCGTTYQPHVKLESPDVSHDLIIDRIARHTGREGETSEDQIAQPMNGETAVNTEIPPVNEAHKDAVEMNVRKRPFKCNMCSKSFRRKHDLTVHMRTHSEERPFSCSVCSKTFLLNQHLIEHTRTHAEKKLYKCNQCPKQYANSRNLTRHKKSHNLQEPIADFKCKLCFKSFTQKCHLHSHMRTHTGERPYKCNLCPKAFTQGAHLSEHLKAHSGEKPYKCNLCPNAFSGRKDLLVHMRTHTGERPFKCDLCSKAFTQKQHLTKHMRIHTGDRPYKCNLCSKAFIRKRGLNTHVKSHTK